LNNYILQEKPILIELVGISHRLPLTLPGFPVWGIQIGFERKRSFLPGRDNKAKLTMKKGCGYKSFCTVELDLQHRLGKLSEVIFTYGFF
jgi:hypothetical protein